MISDAPLTTMAERRYCAVGHGWPFAAAHGAMPSFRHAEPKRGTKWWGKALLVTFGWSGSRLFQK
ncbi:hypothetical protein CVG87_09245 [Pseudomonas sp. WCS365]|nr:hypothetical protein CVG87_09245 [Pseudomonas sp. WCS365]